MNQHFYIRQGVSFKEMTNKQRNAAFGLMQALDKDLVRQHYQARSHVMIIL